MRGMRFRPKPLNSPGFLVMGAAVGAVLFAVGAHLMALCSVHGGGGVSPQAAWACWCDLDVDLFFRWCCCYRQHRPLLADMRWWLGHS
jgi:hypothetical protein